MARPRNALGDGSGHPVPHIRTRPTSGMYAGEGGRACGTIAKVRRYRQKRRGTAST
jgi:hypothetical protein